jgi:hypothetical protein
MLFPKKNGTQNVTAKNLKLPRQNRSRGILTFVTALIIIGSIITALFAYSQIGRTPGELMDYLERRLHGHNKLEVVALPVIGAIREFLNEPSVKVRLKQQFNVPSPPPLRLIKLDERSIGEKNEFGFSGRILRVGKHESIRSIAEASQLARDGDTVEIQAGIYRGDVTTWNQRNLILRGIGGNARIYADGKSAESKAIWVIKNGDFIIENIDFIGARVPDRNGAGIRFENGRLRIRNCLFYNNENGILTTNEAISLEIDNSEFGYNGVGDGFSHNIYVGKIQQLKVTGSYFHHANVGHLLKSRAAFNEIKYNRLTDETGGRASYELDFPNGGVAIVLGNIIQQVRETENSAMISYGAENYIWPENKLNVASNTLINDHPYGGAFLRAYPGVVKIISTNNLLIGPGKYHTPDLVDSVNDIHASWEIFKQAARQNYQLNDLGQQLSFIRSKSVQTLEPRAEYEHPRNVVVLNEKALYPGALQSTNK